MKICLCVVSFMLSGCMKFERVERHHYHGGAATQPQPARQFESVRTITIEVRR